MQRVVLTGGPGAGKTVVLEVLRAEGYTVGEDAARCIIQERNAAGLSPRPDARTFAQQILQREIAAYRSAVSSPAFFERGVVDAIAGLVGAGGLDEQQAAQLMDEYRYGPVFLFPPWKEIYRTDSERDHTFEHSVRVCEGTRRWYQRFGYDMIEVTCDSPVARAEFILARTESA